MTRKRSQLALQLPARVGWGGKRRGAGRKAGDAPGLPHRSRQRFASLPVHVTVKLQRGLPSLRTLRVVREIEQTFARGCARPGFRLAHYSLQGNHAHLIVEARDRAALGRGMMAIGGRLARAINRVAGRSGRVLADRYHAHVLKTPREVRAALRYVLLNARRHARRGVVRNVRPDPASSARWFDGWRRSAGWIELVDGVRARDKGPPAVARARTWLLRAGWRRHGLLDPAEVPG